ncbi:MAG: selenide, water dikinase SelD [Candidatus Kapabacteria bacterium]|jgi:selenide,water dikinase|nr:selenide, water dikinase SelD [Candidatus Kapabacteria bacterium]
MDISQAQEPIRLTQYSHGAGCGCKISPAILDEILHSNEAEPAQFTTGKLLVGNDSRDDAAVYDLGNGQALISTTDFFMPIVDDPFDFGRIAGANAISDVYAMGGTPTMAIAILGWTLDKLSPQIAGRVVSGGRHVCAEAGIPLAGGHSIDSPEPIFGLAVSGLVPIANIKRNNTAQAEDVLFLTKALGVGVLTTAEKRSILRPEDQGRAAAQMMRLNSIGAHLGALQGVTAMTDVTGFGFMGHLLEMCMGSGLAAEIQEEAVPLLPNVREYIVQKSVPGGTQRNFASYGQHLCTLSDEQRAIFCDPQTSGGLLVAVRPDSVQAVQELFRRHGLEEYSTPIGRLIPHETLPSRVVLS